MDKKLSPKELEEKYGAYQTIDALIQSNIGQSLIASGVTEQEIHKKVKKGAHDLFYKKQLLQEFSVHDRNRPDIKVRPSTYKHKVGSGRTFKMAADDPLYTFDLLNIPGRTSQLEGMDMMLLLLTPELEDFVTHMRLLFEIPDKYFYVAKDDYNKTYEARSKHLKELNKTFRKHKLSPPYKTKEPAFAILTELVNLYIRKRTIFEKSVHGRVASACSMLIDFITFNDPFYSLKNREGYAKTESPTHTRTTRPLAPKRFINDSVELTFLVYPTTTKDELRDLIDQEWDEIDSLKKKLPKIKERERIKPDIDYKKMLLVYRARLNGDTYKEIARNYGVGDAQARKIVSDLRNRIKAISASLR